MAVAIASGALGLTQLALPIVVVAGGSRYRPRRANQAEAKGLLAEP